MKWTKLLVVMFLTILGTATANAQFERGEKSVGAKIGYVSKNQSAGVGLFFQYTCSQHLRLAPEIGCVFKHNNLDAFTIDFNIHSPLTFTGNRTELYPLAGLNYSSWNRNYPLEDEKSPGVDVSTRSSRLGLNLGAGFELRCTRTLKAGFEAKYTFIKGFSGATVSALVSYTF